MDKEQILNAVHCLSLSQGFYGRLYAHLTSGTDEGDALMQEMVEQNFADSVDMVLWLEG